MVIDVIRMSSAEASPAVNVPESVLKKRKRDEQWSLARTKEAEEAKCKSIANRKIIFKRAEKYIKEYNQQVNPQALLTFSKNHISVSRRSITKLSVIFSC